MSEGGAAARRSRIVGWCRIGQRAALIHEMKLYEMGQLVKCANLVQVIHINMKYLDKKLNKSTNFRKLNHFKL